MTENRLIVNKLTKAQYEQSSKNPNEVWIITDQLDDYAKTDDIPANTSDLNNDSGFITEDDIPEIPTKTSDLTNDSGFLTEHQSLSNYYTKSEVDASVASRISDPATKSEGQFLRYNGTNWGAGDASTTTIRTWSGN